MALFCAVLMGGCLTGPSTDEVTPPGGIAIGRMAAPALDRIIGEAEWANATLISGDFVIRDSELANGDYPFQARIGHDDSHLYVAVNITAGPNPWSGGGSMYPDGVWLFFQPPGESALVEGADWKSFLNLREHGTRGFDGYWNGRDWVLQQDQDSQWGPEGLQKGTGGRGSFDDHNLWWEIVIPKVAELKGVDLSIGPEGMKLSLAFVRARKTADGPIESYMDVWPGDGYTPENHRDPRTWMQFQFA